MRLWGVLLSRTTRFLIGLGSMLFGEPLDWKPLWSRACTLPDLRCLRPSLPDADVDADAFSTLAWRRVRGGDAALAAGSGAPPSLSSALVMALSFIGTGISSSELSSWYWWFGWPLRCVAGAGAGGWLPALFSACREGGRLRAWRCDVLRTGPVGIGVGDRVAILG